eukprot:364280-Chlamydomonas_euryale.AAC.15
MAGDMKSREDVLAGGGHTPAVELSLPFKLHAAAARAAGQPRSPAAPLQAQPQTYPTGEQLMQLKPVVACGKKGLLLLAVRSYCVTHATCGGQLDRNRHRVAFP